MSEWLKPEAPEPRRPHRWLENVDPAQHAHAVQQAYTPTPMPPAPAPLRPAMGTIKRRTLATLMAIGIYLGLCVVCGAALGIVSAFMPTAEQGDGVMNAGSLIFGVGSLVYAVIKASNWARRQRGVMS